MFCLGIIPKYCKEAIAYTCKENLLFQDLSYKFSLNFNHLTPYMCFLIGIISKYCKLSIANTSNTSKVLYTENLHGYVFFCKISLNFSHLKLSNNGFYCRSHNYLIKGTKRHTCEVLSPCSPLSVVNEYNFNIVIGTSWLIS